MEENIATWLLIPARKALNSIFEKMNSLCSERSKLTPGISLYLIPLIVCSSVEAVAGNDENLFDGSVRDGWSIGMTSSANISPYFNSSSDEISLTPYIAWQKGALYLGIDELRLTLAHTESFSFSAKALPRWPTKTEIDIPEKTTVSRDMSLELGVSATANYQWFYVGGRAFIDSSSVHDGFYASTRIGTSYSTTRFVLDFSAGYQYQDKYLNTFLYGLGDKAAGENVKGNFLTSSSQPFVELQLAYQISKAISIVGSGNIVSLSNTAQQSPLVDKKNDAAVSISLILNL